ncbi:hypothetical protein B0O99DRAFT_636643 [Bisporella sp. PMI_857]|nr:hypothetical protein B0O99DRAFT_636643 [Bisporella sp. PMI_857]
MSTCAQSQRPKVKVPIIFLGIWVPLQPVHFGLKFELFLCLHRLTQNPHFSLAIAGIAALLMVGCK